MCLRVPAEPPRAKYKSPCVWSRFRCLFGSFGEEHELVARNRSKKNEQKTWQDLPKDTRGPEPPAPGKEPNMDPLYVKGSTSGMGQLMSEERNEGRCMLILHEGRFFFIKLMEGGPTGSMDDINDISEHAFFKNSPLISLSSGWSTRTL